MSVYIEIYLMPHHSLRLLTVPVPCWFERVQNTTHLLLLFLRELDVPRSEVLFQALWFCCARDRNHALRYHPCQSNLRQRAALTLREGLDLCDDFLVIVEVLALELRHYFMVSYVDSRHGLLSLPMREREALLTGTTEIIRSEILRTLIREIVD